MECQIPIAVSTLSLEVSLPLSVTELRSAVAGRRALGPAQLYRMCRGCILDDRVSLHSEELRGNACVSVVPVQRPPPTLATPVTLL
jgi:hypothetical protein